jgi:hypothetical protein
MVMADDNPSKELASREPTVEDLRDLFFLRQWFAARGEEPPGV